MADTQDIAFPGADRYAKWLIPVAVGFGVPLFLFFAYNGDPLRGMVASLSAGALVVIASTLWHLRGYIVFWVILAASVVFHVILVWSISGADTHFPGIVLTPLVIVDFLFWQYVIVTAVRKLRR